MVAQLAAPIMTTCDRCGEPREYGNRTQCIPCKARMRIAVTVGKIERKRLVAERFRRIWALVEMIAADPGYSRRELADLFHLSERQVQADLNIIRDDMRLPLVRRQGYRFESPDAASGAGAMTLQDAHTLSKALERSPVDDRLVTVVTKLERAFLPHVAPLAAALLRAITGGRSDRDRVFVALIDAVMTGRAANLSIPSGVSNDRGRHISTVAVTPEVILPYRGGWYIIGRSEQHSRNVMLRVDAVTMVTLSGGRGGR